MKKQTQKIKNWIHENRYNIASVSVIVGFVALAVALDVQVAKQNAEALDAQKKEQEKFNKFLIEENRAGRTVVQLADGSFLGIAM